MIRPLASATMLAPLLLGSALVACSGGDEETDATPTPAASMTSDAPTDPRTLVAGDFGEIELGPRIEGPVGPEVEASIIVDGRSIGDIVSYVACPVEVEECDPDELPEDTVYTYVMTVTPGVDEPNDPPFSRPVGLDEVMAANMFGTTRRANGFTGSIGYDQEQAREALGPDGMIRVADDNGALQWRVVGGDGWETGEAITFFWQGTLPPDGPAEAYSLRADDKLAMASGPFPAAEDDDS